MKLLKKLFKVFIFLIILAISFVGVSIYYMSDSTNLDPKYTNNTNTSSEELNTLLSKSLINTKETGIIDFTFTGDELSYILTTLTKSFNNHLPKQVKINGTLVEIGNDNNIRLSLYASYLFFQTSIKFDSTITSNENEIIIQMHNASLGKIKASANKITSTIEKFISNEKINQKLEESGLDITFNLNDLKIIINKNTIKTIIENKFSSDKNKDLYKTLIDIIFNYDISKLQTENQKFGVKIDINKLSNESVIKEVTPFFYNYELIKEKVELLLKNKTITLKQSNYMFNYLLHGYDEYKDDENYSFIKDLNLSSISITDNEDYEGVFISNTNKTISSILQEQVPNIENLLDPSLNLKISNQNLTNILFETNIAGLSYTFPRIESNGDAKLSYVVIESIYSEIKNNQLSLIIVLNLNNKKINLECILDTKSSNGLVLTTEVNEIKFGTIDLDESLQIQFLSFLESIMAEQSWFKVNSTNKEITLDFVKIFSDNQILNYIISSSTNTNVSLDDDYILIDIGL